MDNMTAELTGAGALTRQKLVIACRYYNLIVRKSLRRPTNFPKHLLRREEIPRFLENVL
jgi:hypothetical protein